MDLSEAQLNKRCLVKNVDIKDEKTKIRIMELGIVEGVKILVFRKSALKKTLLIVFASSCFTLKENLAKQIEVCYA